MSDQTIELEFSKLEGKEVLESGFRQEWLSGKTEEGDSFHIDVGAGVGSPWLIFSMKIDGETQWYRADIRELTKNLVEGVKE